MYVETITQRNGYVLIKEKQFHKDTGRLEFVYTIKMICSNEHGKILWYDIEKEPVTFISLRKSKIRFLLESI